MANILNCYAIQKQQPLEAYALNFKVLMDRLNQQKLKEAISLSDYKRNILVM